MTDVNWNAGYLTDVEYTHGYYRELCPSLLRLACLNAGVAAPAPHALSYLELGMGQGISLNIHAAANEGEFWGTDFNPTHAAHARSVAESASSHAVLLDDSFEIFAQRSDVPEFDMICLHGIWSWISEANRRVIIDFIRRKLRVGGLVYVSYNTAPGWSAAAPLRHLMKLHHDLVAAEAVGVLTAVDQALAFCHRLSDLGALYFHGNPAVQERLKKMKEANRQYLAHEHFNDHWQVMQFSDVAKAFDSAKLTFAASATLLDHIDGINLRPEWIKLLSEFNHPVLKQTVRDYLTNQQFRRDIFIKGPRRCSPLEHSQALRAQQFVLVSPPGDVPMKVTGMLGESLLHESVYQPVLAALAENDFSPKDLTTLSTSMHLKKVDLPTVTQVLFMLVGAGYVFPALQPTERTLRQCRAMNDFLCRRARTFQEDRSLASPVTGAGVPVSRLHRLFILAVKDGTASAQHCAKFAWELFNQTGQRMSKEGKTLQSPQENMAELELQAKLFVERRLPVLQALKVI